MWRDPATIANPNQKFEIVHALNHIGLQERWQRPDAISFVKLTLECALKEAIRRKAQRVGADHEYWSEPERLAVNALAPLRELIEHMKPDGLKYYINTDGYGRLRVRLKRDQCFEAMASRLVRRRMWAMSTHAVSVAADPSKSLARRRHLPHHASVRSTTQRFGKSWKPLTPGGRSTISILHDGLQ